MMMIVIMVVTIVYNRSMRNKNSSKKKRLWVPSLGIQGLASRLEVQVLLKFRWDLDFLSGHS